MYFYHHHKQQKIDSVVLKQIFFYFQRGEKMTKEEVNAVLNLAGVNANGKFDYMKVDEPLLI